MTKKFNDRYVLYEGDPRDIACKKFHYFLPLDFYGLFDNHGYRTSCPTYRLVLERVKKTRKK